MIVRPQELTFKENAPEEGETPLSCEVLLDGAAVDRIWFDVSHHRKWSHGGNTFRFLSEAKEYIRQIYGRNEARYEVRTRGIIGEKTMGCHLSLLKARDQARRLANSLGSGEDYPAHKRTACRGNTQIFIWDHKKNEEVEFNGECETVEWIADEIGVAKSTIYGWIRKDKAITTDVKAKIGYCEVTEVYLHSLPKKYKEILKEKRRKR